jgi:hypothetical protein
LNFIVFLQDQDKVSQETIIQDITYARSFTFRTRRLRDVSRHRHLRAINWLLDRRFLKSAIHEQKRSAKQTSSREQGSVEQIPCMVKCQFTAGEGNLTNEDNQTTILAAGRHGRSRS